MPRGTVVVAALVVMMVTAAGLLTVDSRRAASTARQNADRVLRDYASFAAWQYARAGSRALEQAFSAAITQPSAAHAGAHSAAVKAADCKCEATNPGVRVQFRLDLGADVWIGPAITGVDRDAIEARVRGDRPVVEARGLRIVVFEDGAGAVAWHVDTRDDAAEAIAHGVLVDRSFLQSVLHAASKETLLPPALLESADAGGVLAVRAIASQGHLVFESQGLPWQPGSASEGVPAAGGLRMAASLSREAAPQLIIGGLPRSRLFAVYALLGLASALVLTAGYQLRREAELARLRADFVSGVSHELRTPLTQIRIFTETLRLGRVRTAAESARALDVILQESQRLSQLVDKVLVFSRGERSAHVIHRAPASLTDLVLEVAEDLRPLAKARQASLQTTVEPAIEAIVDRDALRQVLVNLVDNALKFGPPGQRVTIGLRRGADGASLWVEDQGPGIPAEDVRRIWEPFWRRASSGQGGSGIGLSIVRDLVRLHEGRVVVDAACATGARFVATLPLRATGANPA